VELEHLRSHPHRICRPEIARQVLRHGALLRDHALNRGDGVLVACAQGHAASFDRAVDAFLSAKGVPA